MKYFLDMVEPPTVDQARAMVVNGWTGCAVYVGGPRAAAHDHWHQVDGVRAPVGDLAGIFDFFVPVWVGANQPWDVESAFSFANGVADGEKADQDTGACGFGPTTPLGLDVEYGTFQAHPDATLQYILGWVSSVNAAGHPAGVYSDLETLSHLEPGLQVDWKWGAAWVRGFRGAGAPIGGFDPSSPPPWDLWQFASTSIAGVSVDCNSAADSFVGATYG